MAAQPATKADLLGTRMQQLVQQDTVTELEIAKLRRDANEILQSSPNVAHMVLGYLAALNGNEGETRSHFRTAFRLDPSQVSHSNFSQALHRLNLYSEALAEASESYRVAPSNPSVLDDLIVRSVYAGAILGARGLLDGRKLLHLATTSDHEEFVRSTSELMLKNGVSDSETQALQEIASSVLRDNHQYARRAEFLIQEDEDSRWASVWYQVHASIEIVGNLNMQYCERLAAIDPLPTTDRTLGFIFVTGGAG
jgi:hypothetical protein